MMNLGRLGRTLWSRLTPTVPADSETPPDNHASVGYTSPPDPLKLPRSVSNQDRVEGLQRALERRFNDSTLLREALTHRSYLNEINQAWPSNERLEFLGDAVLGMISTDYLFNRFPDLGEGELTNLRSALVRTETLARFAQEIDLGSYLLLGRGEEMSQGRRRPGGLACAFEALLGAIYLDQGYDGSRDFALGFLEPELNMVVEGRLHKNAKSVLQELIQARMQQTPSYHLIEETGPDHAKSFTVEVRVGSRVLARGHDRSKRGAEQAAAQAALAHMDTAPPRAQASM
jgi:ribonuclease III